MPVASPARKAARNSNLELLRIVFMALIVFHHFVVHGGDVVFASRPSLHSIIVDVATMAGQVGVDGFVLVTGYFFGKAKRSHALRTASLYWQTTTYGLIIMAVLVVGGVWQPTARDVWQTVVASPFVWWWFMSAYMALLLLSPALVVMLENLSQRLHLYTIAAGLVLFVLLPQFVDVSPFMGYLSWFAYLSILANYAARYRLPGQDRPWLWLVLAAVGLAAGCARAEWLYGSAVGVAWNPQNAAELLGRNYLPNLLCAVGLFMFFSGLKARHSKLVNWLGGATLGVYLIHDHPQVRAWLWGWLQPGAHFEGRGYYLYALACVAGVYAATTALSLVHEQLLMRPFRWVWRRAALARADAKARAKAVGADPTQGSDGR
ncbi:MAG: acyltransferase [Propionibacteriaceae bacterium]|jgi:surface polysaccharide O-acyltransferase-like enzyme|nr:acyltransferase [Propionibacteriaceae bacterium]